MRDHGRFARSQQMTPAWRKYWEEASSPHPDRIGAQKPLGAGREAITGQGYCHHYRLPNEHYHPSMTELEGCER
jgi:hypothetical protein